MAADRRYAIPAQRTNEWPRIGGYASPKPRAARAMGLEGATTPAGASNGLGAVSGLVVWGEMVDTTSASAHAAIALEEHVPAGPARPGALDVWRASRPCFRFTMCSRVLTARDR